MTVSHCSAGTLRCFQSASGVQREQPGTLFQSLLYKHHESIYTLRCLRTFSLRCTHIYRQTHTHTGWPSDEISFCHLACCVTRCISPAKASAAIPALSLSGVSLKATHTAVEPHTQGDGRSTAATL